MSLATAFPARSASHLVGASPRDRLLTDWTEWRDHDGQGVPALLIGKEIMVAGDAHDGISRLPDRILRVTPDYVASVAADVWDWSKGWGGVTRYRLRRAAPLVLDQVVIDALQDLAHACGRRALQFGMDGVAE